MENRIININPLDLDTTVAIGVSLPFNGRAVFNSTFTTTDQIKSNLINLLLTNTNERVMNPNFGANLRRLLFEQITELDIVQGAIEDKIEAYIPEVVLKQVLAIPSQDTNTINIQITYSIKNTGIEDEININFEK